MEFYFYEVNLRQLIQKLLAMDLYMLINCNCLIFNKYTPKKQHDSDYTRSLKKKKKIILLYMHAIIVDRHGEILRT